MNRSASMNGILLVAAREIRQILKMKSFWLTLLILPVALAIGPLFAETLEDDEPTRVVVVDRSGGQTAEALEARFAAEDAQWLLRDLSRYVQRYDLEAADPQAPWAQHDRWYTGADIAAFESQGGLEAALAKIDAVRPEGVPEFEPDTPDYSFEPAPAELASAQGDAFCRCRRARPLRHGRRARTALRGRENSPTTSRGGSCARRWNERRDAWSAACRAGAPLLRSSQPPPRH